MVFLYFWCFSINPRSSLSEISVSASCRLARGTMFCKLHGIRLCHRRQFYLGHFPISHSFGHVMSPYRWSAMRCRSVSFLTTSPSSSVLECRIPTFPAKHRHLVSVLEKPSIQYLGTPGQVCFLVWYWVSTPLIFFFNMTMRLICQANPSSTS